MPKKFKCPCCRFLTYESEPDGNYDICPVCFWEDDPVQSDNEHCDGGANKVSLVEARKNFQGFGACERDMIKNVRPPTDDEKPR